MKKAKNLSHKKLISELQELYNTLETMKKSNQPREQMLEISSKIQIILRSLLEDIVHD